MPRALSEQVVVVVGATSGIGLLAARKFAHAGASVVLVARSETALHALANEIRQQGGTALVVPADVTDWEQVNNVATEAVRQFGRIDTWVNNASVAIYAMLEDTTIDEFKRVLDVNVNGQFHGIKAALAHMRAQRSGTIICVGSVVSVRAVPYMGAYNASKAALRGIVETLRMELEYERAGVDVTLILPASINTPLFSHTRSKIGAMARPLLPIYRPEVVADAIVYAAEHPQRDIYVGGGGWLLALGQRLSPALMDRFFMLGGWSFKVQRGSKPPPASDNLFAPTPDTGNVEGEYRHLAKPSLYTRLFELAPAWQRLVLSSGIAGAIALLVRRREQRNQSPMKRMHQKFQGE